MIPGMAKTKAPPVIDPGVTVIKRRRRRRITPPVNQWTPAQAREMGRLSGGRPKGSVTSPILTVSAFMLSVFRDPEFQADFRWRAQNGLLNSSEIQNMCYFAEGRPTYKVEVTKPIDPDEAADRAAMLRMSLEERRAMTDAIRKFNALRAEQPIAIPQTTRPEAEDAEIVAP